MPSSGSTIHTRSRTKPARVLQSLLRQHGVVGSGHRERIGDEALGGGVAGVHHLPGRESAAEEIGVQGHEHHPGLGGEAPRQRGVALGGVTTRAEVGVGRGGLPSASRGAMLTSAGVPGPEPEPDPEPLDLRPTPPGGGDTGLDHLGARRLSLRETWVWYIVAGVTYVAVATYHKFVLNWIVGPLWLVVVVVVGPDCGSCRAAWPMSWAAHQFETYAVQAHLPKKMRGKVSFFGIFLGDFTPDFLSKFWVYGITINGHHYGSSVPQKWHRAIRTRARHRTRPAHRPWRPRRRGCTRGADRQQDLVHRA